MSGGWGRIAVVGIVTAVAAGCGGAASAHRTQVGSAPTTTTPSTYPPLDVTAQVSATLPAASPVGPYAGPAPNQQDLVFASSTTGFLVTGAFQGTGLIQRTTDDGATWQTVWSEAGAFLYWVGSVANEVLAAGTYIAPGADPNSAPTPLMLESPDGGTTWSSFTPVLPSLPTTSGTQGQGSTQGVPAGAPGGDWGGLRLDFVTPNLAFAVTDASEGQTGGPPELLRSTDGARHWSQVLLPGGSPSGGLAFVDAEHGFATGALMPASSQGSCESQIWSTSDSGLTWTPVQGTCVDWAMDALSFPDATHGFAAGGNFSKFGMFPQRALLATTDGGAHWSKLYADGGNAEGGGPDDDGPWAALRFVSDQRGYALVGGCTIGANGPCGGNLWTTTDGGAHWSKDSASGLRLALAGPDDVWLAGDGPEGSSSLWHSTDGGTSWAALVNPTTISINELAGGGSALWVDTAEGQFLSTDFGRSWSDLPAAALAAEGSGAATVVDVGRSGLMAIGSLGAQEVWISHDWGRNGSEASLPDLGRDGGAGIAFSDDKHGLVLGQGGECAKPAGPPGQVAPPYSPSPARIDATDDGGSSWHSLGTLALGGPALAYGTTVALATGALAGSTPPCPSGIAISFNGGANWKTWSAPAGLRCGAPSAAGDTAILVCPDYSSATPATTILMSRDAARTWKAIHLTGPVAYGQIIATGPGQLWADGAPGTLWHSTDGGEHWSAQVPSFPVAQ